MRNSGRSAGQALGRRLAALCGAIALAGCVSDLAAPEPSQADLASASSAGVDDPGAAPVLRLVAGAVSDIDPSLVPDPDSFAAELAPVWDGLPTMQGVWIAHPLADRARRVRLTNLQTGAQVDGAMFRRDPNRDGPAVAISSEAAGKLGIAPDTETPVAVVALVRAGPAAVSQAGAEGPGSEAATGPGDPAAGEAGVPDGSGTAGDAPPPADGASELTAAAASGAETSGAIPAEQGSQATKATADPASASFERAQEQPAAASISGSGHPGEPRARMAPQADTGGGAGALGAVGSAPAPDAAPAAPPRRLAALDRPTATTEQPVSEPGAAGAITDGMPYIQAGIFSDPENATRLVAELRGRGLPAEALALPAGQRGLTRVVVGPFGSVAARNAALATVREIGPSDAIPVKG